ncbi:MAG: DNA-binding protein [Proteobacteria bacterium]|nr:MAG: DNA-binding protein [Pseudomonadota bacterium]
MSLKQGMFQKQLKNVMKFARNWQKGSIFVFNKAVKHSAFILINFYKHFKMEQKKETYLTVKDYAQKYGITVQTVYNKIKNKELKTKKVLHTTLVKV